MARGKYRASRRSKDLLALAQELAEVRRAIALERAAGEQAQILHARFEQASRELTEAQQLRETRVSPVVQTINAEAAVIEQAALDMASATRSLRKAWDTLVSQLVSNDVSTHEEMIDLFSGGRSFFASETRKGVSAQASVAIDFAQGRRTRPPGEYTEDERLVSSEALRRLRVDSSDGYLPAEPTPTQQLALAHPIPWLDESRLLLGSESPARDALGATDPNSVLVESPSRALRTPDELLTAAARAATAAAGVDAVIDAWGGWMHRRTRVVNGDRDEFALQTESMPRMPFPVDAARVRHAYVLAALGEWVRSDSNGFGEFAVGVAASSLFWLPPGQTSGYAESEPLSDEDRDALRLPFPSVTLALADPIRIDPGSELDSAAEQKLRWLDREIHRSAKKSSCTGDQLCAGTSGYERAPLELDAAIRSRGALIEGVVFFADAAGVLRDQIGWCIALPSTTGKVLGRWVVPAQLSDTVYRDQVLNLAAVIAWGRWHSGGNEEHPDTATAGAGWTAGQSDSSVHVLDVKSTESPSSPRARGAATGRHVRAHRRRGHWRRQHYGPGNAQTKRVRIAPVLVNPSAAAAVTGAESVYRLPSLF